jgi:hypothetical protein
MTAAYEKNVSNCDAFNTRLMWVKLPHEILEIPKSRGDKMLIK